MPLRLTYIDMGSKRPSSRPTRSPTRSAPAPTSSSSAIQGHSVKLTRFDGYWGEIPYVKDVTYVYRTEAAVRAGMIETGEAQLATAIRPRTRPATTGRSPTRTTASS